MSNASIDSSIVASCAVAYVCVYHLHLNVAVLSFIFSAVISHLGARIWLDNCFVVIVDLLNAIVYVYEIGVSMQSVTVMWYTTCGHFIHLLCQR